MPINYKTISIYKRELREFQKLLSEEVLFDPLIQDLALDNQIAIAAKKVDELPASYDAVLEEYNLTREDLIVQVAETVFPLSTEEAFEEDVALLETAIAEKRFTQHLYKEFNDEFNGQFDSIMRQLDYVNENDGAFLKRLFQSNKVKREVELKKVSLKATFDRINQIKKTLEPSHLKEAFKTEYIDVENRPSYQSVAEELVKVIDFKPGVQADIISELAQKYFRDVKNKTSLIDLRTIDDEIEQNWEQRKLEKGTERLANLSIDVLDHIEEGTKIPTELIDYYEIKNMEALKNLTLSQIESVVNPVELSAQEVRDTIFSVTDELLEGFYPRLDANNLSENDMELLDLMHRRQLIPSNIQDSVSKIYELVDFTQVDLDKSTVDQNEYQNYITQNRPSPERNFYANFLDESLRQISSLVKDTKAATRVLTNEETIDLQDDFKQNSANYYALLDQVTQQAGEIDTDHIPSKIVQAVKGFKLNLHNLKGVLRPYQDFGTKFGLHFKRTLLGDEMGLGKTIQGIAIAQHLYNDGKKHTLMVGPLSILTNWQREIKQWSTIPSYLYRGVLRASSYQQWHEHGGILLTNYEQLGHLCLEDVSFLDFMIIDEAHKIKNPQTKMATHSRYIIDQSEYVLLMTGTPIENRLNEMTQLIKYLNSDLAEHLYESFVVPTPEEYKMKTALVYLRRRRADVLRELPEKKHIPLWSAFNDEQQIFYNDALGSGLAGLQAMRYAAFKGNNASQIEKIQQIMEICAQAKIEGNKVLIFSFYTNYVLNQIQRFIKDDVIGAIHGQVSVKDRQELIDKFSKADDGAILLSQIESGGVGLNIQAANVVIMCEPQWKPSIENQAISRVYRMGQTKDVLVYHLLTQDSIDETMVEVLNYKQNIFDQYADESEVARAYDQKEAAMKNKVLEIERERLKKTVV